MEFHRSSTIHKCLCKRNDQQIKSLAHLALYGIISMHVWGGWWWWMLLIYIQQKAKILRAQFGSKRIANFKTNTIPCWTNHKASIHLKMMNGKGQNKQTSRNEQFNTFKEYKLLISMRNKSIHFNMHGHCCKKMIEHKGRANIEICIKRKKLPRIIIYNIINA